MYEPLVVGKYCEKRDPYLAYIAYAKGFCDEELIQITNENSMFKQQARYLVKRRRIELWQQVLVPDNLHRRALIEQVSRTYCAPFEKRPSMNVIAYSGNGDSITREHRSRRCLGDRQSIHAGGFAAGAD